MSEETRQQTMTANELSHEIIKAALKVHSALGPGLLEKAYRVCLTHELRNAGFKVGVEVDLPLSTTASTWKWASELT
jgi:GxxExxY protein